MASRDAATGERLAESAAKVRARSATHTTARRPLVAVAVIAVGLVLAPFIFQMLGGGNRALKGHDMMNAFKPYMTEPRITNFQGFLATINTAEEEARMKLLPAVQPSATTPAQKQAVASVSDWSTKWRGQGTGKVGIFPDMSGMVNTIARNVDNYAAVKALPPFFLFPFFFIVPGLVIAALAFAALKRVRRGVAPGGLRTALVVMGAGLIAAPFIFQMMGGENRAFQGKDMIDDFKPIMTMENITSIQGYFPVIGLAEGQLRNEIVPLAAKSGGGSYPAVAQFSGTWNTISSEFADFLGVMNDELRDYNAVKALPPFSLFPFFFILPGLLVVGLAFAAGRHA